MPNFLRPNRIYCRPSRQHNCFPSALLLREGTAGLEPGEEGRVGWFPVGGSGPLSRCCHTTATVDLRVSADRVIAVDTPPVLSPSVLAKLHLSRARKAVRASR
jgi:hypothetical protein